MTTAARVRRSALVASALLAFGAAPALSAISVQLSRGGGSPAHGQGGRRRSLEAAAAVPVEDCENLEYTGTIGLGTPAQEFRVVFSIVASYLWVVNTECEFCESPSGGYDSSLSSTYEPDGSAFSIDTSGGNAEATGVLSVDVLTMGGVSTTVTFGEMTEATLEGCTMIDGTIGMGLTNEYESNAFEDMVEAGVIDTPVFSFFMGNVDNDAPNNGVLTLGGVNQTHYEGCLEWMPVSEAQDETSDLPGSVPDGYWSVVLKDVKLGSNSVLRSEATAVLDTGTPLIQGPFDDVAVLAEQIGAMCLSFGQYSSSTEVVDCLNDPSAVELIFMECEADFGDVNFFFGGDDFALTAKELLQPLEDFGLVNPSSASDPMCLFGMVGADLVDTWVLGDPFLRNFYTAYNVLDKTVGIAPATSKRVGDECHVDNDPGSPPAADGDGGDDNENAQDESGDDQSAGESAADGDSAADDDDGHGLDAASAPADGSGSSSAHTGAAGTAQEEPTSLLTIGVVASLGTMALIGCGVAVLVARQRWKRLRSGGAYRSTIGGGVGGGGGGGGGFEMSWSEKKGSSASTAGARHGEVVEPEEDFLQAPPRGGGGRVVRGVATRRDGADDEEEVEVDLSGGGGRGAAATGTKAGGGVFGRLLAGAPARAGFAAFENAEEEGGVQ